MVFILVVVVVVFVTRFTCPRWRLVTNPRAMIAERSIFFIAIVYFLRIIDFSIIIVIAFLSLSLFPSLP
jgi:hypothetical protein